MRWKRRVPIPDPKSALILAGHSVRSLAQSARASGIRVVALDHYADLDTRAAAWQTLQVRESLGETLEQVLLGPRGEPFASAMLVVGAGFEGKGDTLVALARRFQLIGNAPAVWDAVDAPEVFASLLDRLSIPHPEVRVMPPARLEEWLFKGRGSCGGMGVYPADDARGMGSYSRRVRGQPASVLFVADGRRARILGYHYLLTHRLPGRPFVYAGALVMDTVPASVSARIDHWVAGLTATLGLCGLNGLDFIVNAGQPCCLELNPRPTATVELHEHRLDSGGLIALHLQGCAGELPARLPTATLVRGLRVIYSNRELRIPRMDWPDWSADRPAAGTLVGLGEPICSVHGEGRTVLELRQSLARRSRCLRSRLLLREPAAA